MKTSLLQHSRQRRHGRTANADKMNVFLCHDLCTAVDVRRLRTAGPYSNATLLPTIKLRAYSKRQSEISAGNMARLKAKRNRNTQVADNSHHNLLEGVIVARCAGRSAASRQK